MQRNMDINKFWNTYKIKSPQKDFELISSIWVDNAETITKNWYTQIFEHIGKRGTTVLLSDVNRVNYESYKKYLGKTHLDIGSGTGFTSMYIYNEAKIKVDMIDIYDKDLNESVKNILNKDFNFHLYKSGEDLNFLNSEYNSASLFYVLHHCDTRNISLKLLKDIRGKLLNNGHLIIIDEPVNTITDRKRADEIDVIVNSYYATSGFNNNSGFDIANFYTRNELESQFIDAGFSIVLEKNDMEWSWLLPRSLYILKKVK